MVNEIKEDILLKRSKISCVVTFYILNYPILFTSVGKGKGAVPPVGGPHPGPAGPLPVQHTEAGGPEAGGSG